MKIDQLNHTSKRRQMLLSILLLAASLSPFPALRSDAQSAVAPRPAQTQEFQVLAPGIEYLQMKRGAESADETKGPWVINLLRVDLGRARVEAVHVAGARRG